MISPGRQRVKIKKYLYNLYFYDFHIIRFAFYTCLSSLYNYHLKYISLIILLGEVQKFLGEALKISGGAVIPGGGGVRTSLHLSLKSGLAIICTLGVHVTSAMPCWMISTKNFDHLQIKCHLTWRKSLCLLYPSRLVAHLQYVG